MRRSAILRANATLRAVCYDLLFALPAALVADAATASIVSGWAARSQTAVQLFSDLALELVFFGWPLVMAALLGAAAMGLPWSRRIPSAAFRLMLAVVAVVAAIQMHGLLDSDAVPAAGDLLPEIVVGAIVMSVLWRFPHFDPRPAEQSGSDRPYRSTGMVGDATKRAGMLFERPESEAE